MELGQALAAAPAFAQEKPNIVDILVDNWGWGDLSVQGSTVSTPRIDTLAAEGLRLTNFNVQTNAPRRVPPCIPAVCRSVQERRKSLLQVNRTAWRHGNTRSQSCFRMPGMQLRSTANGT